MMENALQLFAKKYGYDGEDDENMLAMAISYMQTKDRHDALQKKYDKRGKKIADLRQQVEELRSPPAGANSYLEAELQYNQNLHYINDMDE